MAPSSPGVLRTRSINQGGVWKDRLAPNPPCLDFVHTAMSPEFPSFKRQEAARICFNLHPGDALCFPLGGAYSELCAQDPHSPNRVFEADKVWQVRAACPVCVLLTAF